jgi:hypothetical protein
MNHAFQRNKHKRRNRYLDSWTETGWQEIPLSFDSENLATVLSWGTREKDSQYTHQDIAHWCDRFYMAFMSDHQSRKEQQPISRFAEIANDVSAQWDLYLSNTYTLEQLQTLKFSTITLPLEWFRDWLKRVKDLQS